MKKIYIIIVLFLVGCTKKGAVTNTVTNTVTNVCKQTEILTYDGTGTYTGKYQRFYTNKVLDSVINYQGNGLTLITIYESTPSGERKGVFYDQNRVKTGGYTLEKVDVNGNTVELSSYNQDGKLNFRQIITYKCD
jgi:hypothetical protein